MSNAIISPEKIRKNVCLPEIFALLAYGLQNYGEADKLLQAGIESENYRSVQPAKREDSFKTLPIYKAIALAVAFILKAPGLDN